MRGLLIDPEAQTIVELEVGGNDIEDDIEKAIDCCEYGFAYCYIDGPNHENVLFNDVVNNTDPDEDIYGFLFHFDGFPFIGKAMILGSDAKDDFIGTTLSVQKAYNQIKWFGAR